MVGVMFQPGNRVIFDGGSGVLVPVGSKGTIVKKEERFLSSSSDLYDVRFDAANGSKQVSQICDAKYLSYYFSINDKIKIIGRVGGIDNRYLGFEGTVIDLNHLKIRIVVEGRFHDLYVEASSLEKLDSIIGSKWWV